MPHFVDVMSIKTIAELMRLNLGVLRDREEAINAGELRHMLKIVRGYFLHPGKERPDIPHPAGYTLHLNGYIDFPQILCMPNIAEILAFEMAKMVKKEDLGLISWVVGPERASFSLALFMAKFLGARYGVVEKDGSGKLAGWERFTIYPGERVLVINDVMSSIDGSTLETMEIVEGKNPYHPVSFVEFAAVLVNHSRLSELLNGTRVLFRYRFPEIQAYDPDSCELCDAGSKVLKPKGRENRAQFLRHM